MAMEWSPCRAVDLEDHDNGYEDELCSQCRSLGLQANDFYVPADVAREEIEGDTSDPILLDSRSWASLKAESECSLCRLIVYAVEKISRSWQVNDTPQSCTIRTSRMNLNERYGDEGMEEIPDSEWDLRSLDVIAKYRYSESDKIHLLPVQSNHQPEPFIGRRVATDGIDTRQILGWLHQCEMEHAKCDLRHGKHVEVHRESESRETETQTSFNVPENLWVINVRDQCIVKLPATQRYLALSYVWGGVEQTNVDSQLLKQLTQPGGLSSTAVRLPTTVRDAIKLVKLLNERYLWVDALCIIRDDPASEQAMIDQMHSIYRHAYMTVIAATGTDANTGLPGVSTPRDISQKLAKVSEDLTFIFPIHYLAIKDSVWASRAWTLLEMLPRHLGIRNISSLRDDSYFFAGQVIYQCNTLRWREDIAQEHLNRGVTYYQINIGGDRMDWEPPKVRSRTGAWDRNRYVEYLESYIDRRLTKDSDIERAFTGILKDAAEHGLETHFGLTKRHFAIDLLWQPCRWLTRRPGGFPSWSWLGWKGAIIMFRFWPDFPSADVCVHRMSWIRFFGVDEGGQSSQLISESHSPAFEEDVAREEYFHFLRERRMAHRGRAEDEEEGEGQESFYKGWNGNVKAGSVLTPLLSKLANGMNYIGSGLGTHEYGRVHSSNVNNGLLRFRTMTGTLRISPFKPNGKLPRPPPREDPFLPTAPNLFLYTSEGAHIGTAWVHSEELYNEMVTKSTCVASAAADNSFDVEIAVIAGPVRADWRTREEAPSLKQLAEELVFAGCNARDIIARTATPRKYHSEISQVMGSVMEARFTTEELQKPIEEVGLDDDFWAEVEERVAHKNPPGHGKDTFDAFRDIIMNTNSHLRVDVKQRYYRVLLIGDLDSGIVSGTGKVVEMFGKGEIKDNCLSLIDGLAFRDVWLK